MGVAATAAGSYDELASRVHNAGYIFVGIIVALLLAILIGKKVLNRIEARHMTRDADTGGTRPEEGPHTEA